MVASSSRELAGVSDFAAADGTNLRNFDRRHSSCMTVKSGEFHFIRLAVLVDMHHGPYVPSL
ncbi:MAG: hypothetical protein A3H95_17605 [Acidobacteria bacterium RIFCSPLOWO2_02_FULL_64_15]|nr:MAG: hypothetical protein A3H95_17605 [Acidobacteria bacterium RIFCSPLOWO2_02_FULL_64_15]